MLVAVVVAVSGIIIGSVEVLIGVSAIIKVVVAVPVLILFSVEVAEIGTVDVAITGVTGAEAVSITADTPMFCVIPQAPVEILIISFST